MSITLSNKTHFLFVKFLIRAKLVDANATGEILSTPYHCVCDYEKECNNSKQDAKDRIQEVASQC